MTFSNSINWLRRDGPRWENLGITLSAGTFSITAADGTALSATNAGYVTIPSKANPGQQIVYRITANQSFVDDAGSSTIIGNLFGLTTGIAYAQDLPFYIYAVSNDAATAVSFMISRVPHRTVAPLSTAIGKTGSAIADTQGSFFAFGDPTVTDYDGNPCVCIGAIRMRMSASDDWTVQALSDGSTAAESNIQADGIGCFHEGTKFTLTTGQFGNASGKFFQDNGGTAPSWTTQVGNFSINKAGFIHLEFAGTTSTAGAGAVNATIGTPYININTSGTTGTIQLGGGVGIAKIVGANTQFDAYINASGSVVSVTNANINTATNVRLQLTYTVDPM